MSYIKDKDLYSDILIIFPQLALVQVIIYIDLYVLCNLFDISGR